jgi:hypothetical protein
MSVEFSPSAGITRIRFIEYDLSPCSKAPLVDDETKVRVNYELRITNYVVFHFAISLLRYFAISVSLLKPFQT